MAVKQAEETTAKANERVKEVEEDLRTAETIRRKLHNQVQELKGVHIRSNILHADAHHSDVPKETFESLLEYVLQLVCRDSWSGIDMARLISIMMSISFAGNEVATQDDLAEIEYPAKGVVTVSGQEPLTVYKSRDNAEGKNTREAIKFSFDKVSTDINTDLLSG